MKYLILAFVVGFVSGVVAESWIRDWDPEEYYDSIEVFSQ